MCPLRVLCEHHEACVYAVEREGAEMKAQRLLICKYQEERRKRRVALPAVIKVRADVNPFVRRRQDDARKK